MRTVPGPARDPFLRKFLARVPADVGDSFSDAQLDAIKRAFGAREWGAHAVDVRRSFRLFRFRYYLVVLIGRERRGPDRLAAEGWLLGSLGNMLITLLFLLLLLSPLLVALYVVKSAVGLDLVAGSGAHDLWRGVTEQLRLLFD